MILAEQFVDKKVIQRFRGEVTTAALLQHPNIVPVHEVGLHAGQHFFSMDYVEGQSLAQLVGDRPLPPTKAAHYLKLIAEAIHYAHSQGILHRDLKPSNVLIEAATDQPRVTDFGLATRIEGESSLTLTGQVLGSPGFIAPEQASPDRGKVGRRSDVYALGAILYHLLTARAPFQGGSLPAIVTQVLNSEPISPPLLNPSVPRDLETICLKCLEKEPGRRYTTAKELADDLGRFLNGEPVHARPVSGAEKVWRWCRRKPALATLGVVVLFLVIVVGFGTPIALVRINRARLDAERNLYAADMRLASQALRDGAIGQVQELLGAHEPRNGAEDLRGFEWRYLRHAADQTGLVTHQLQGLRATQIFSNPRLIVIGGTLYNLQEETSQILAWDMTTWAQFPLKLPPQRTSERWWWYPAQQAALSVNDKDRTMEVYRLPTFEEVSVVPVPGKASQAAVSKDLRTLAVGFQDGDTHRILEWDMAAGSQRGVFGKYQAKVTYLAFSPDDSVLVAACDDGEIGLWSITQGKALLSPVPDSSTTEQDWNTPPFFGPGLTRLYFSRGNERKALEVWDWSTGKLSVAYQAHRGELGAFAFSPNGAVLATAGSAEVIVLLDTKESRQIDAMPVNGAMITSLAFSPSGSLIASASRDHTAKLWDVKTQRELATLGGNDDQVNEVAFTPDEKSVITLLGNGKIKVWDLRAVLGRGVLWRTTNMIEGLIVSAGLAVA
ncbi:MAG: hypothetical protein DME19_12410 [Verrucomicrobia bacterium]|nr:MAG: hypothetical protein DME19_12410 [Verrucomicrobiota bacterium]